MSNTRSLLCIYIYIYTLCPDKNWTHKEIVIIQQNRGIFIFRHTNNRANQQEKAMLIETYIRHCQFCGRLKCNKVSNKAPFVYSQWESVKQIQATLHAADVQSDLLVLEHITADVDAIAWWPSRWSWDQTSSTLQPDVTWGDWRQQYVRRWCCMFRNLKKTRK